MLSFKMERCRDITDITHKISWCVELNTIFVARICNESGYKENMVA